MFLEDRDYKVVCNDDTLDIITQSDEQTRRDAERSAHLYMANALSHQPQ